MECPTGTPSTFHKQMDNYYNKWDISTCSSAIMEQNVAWQRHLSKGSSTHVPIALTNSATAILEV